MIFALLLWLFSALIAATVAVERCTHLQLGLVFVLLAAVPPVLFACALRRKPRKEKPKAIHSPENGCAL